jgi:hypothetical protein
MRIAPAICNTLEHPVSDWVTTPCRCPTARRAARIRRNTIQLWDLSHRRRTESPCPLTCTLWRDEIALALLGCGATTARWSRNAGVTSSTGGYLTPCSVRSGRTLGMAVLSRPCAAWQAKTRSRGGSGFPPSASATARSRYRPWRRDHRSSGWLPPARLLRFFEAWSHPACGRTLRHSGGKQSRTPDGKKLPGGFTEKSFSGGGARADPNGRHLP